MDDFASKYERDDADAKRYRVLKYVTSNFFVAIYFSTAFLGWLFNSIATKILLIQEQQFGIPGFTLLLSLTLGLGISVAIYLIFKNQRVKLDFSEREVAYHYLASAITAYLDDDLQRVMDYLVKFQDYVGEDRPVLHPARQEELNEYIDAISNSPQAERNEILHNTFKENISLVVSDISRIEEAEMDIPSVMGATSDEPSTPEVLIEAIVESISLNPVKLLFGVLVLGAAIGAYITGGTTVALIILAAFPVIQYITPGEDSGDT